MKYSKILMVMLVLWFNFLSLQSSEVNTSISSKDSQISNALQNKDVKQDSDTSLTLRSLSFIDLYHHADNVVKSVIYILLLFSIITWCVFIYKIWQYYLSFKTLNDEILKLDNNNFQFFKHIKSHSYTKRLIHVIENERKISKDYISPNHKSLDSLKNRLKLTIENTINSFITHNKKGVALLASIGSSAPFIGLFGTVWGIMNSFIGIANSSNVSLSAVAPGISEALFATAFGLIAAIPAVLFYNYLTRLGINFSHKMNDLATRIYILSDREISQMEQ